MSNNINDTELLEQLVDAKNNFFLEIGKIVIGQKGILDQMLIALLTKGHTLLVGVPGLAKTLLIKSMAEICDLNFKRIQFTPDLMPSDITGTELIDIDEDNSSMSSTLDFDLLEKFIETSKHFEDDDDPEVS